MRLSGKVVVVTGAAGGIGRAACLRLAADGAAICATDLVSSVEPEMPLPPGAQYSYFPADLTKTADRSGFIEACRVRHGRIDGVFANHGAILGKSFLETTEDDWDRIQAVNLKSTYFMIQAAVPHMPAGGSIVVMSSAAGILARPSMSAYSASKSGINMLAKSLSLDLGGLGIRVNAVAPGLVDTPMPRGFLRNLANSDEVWAGMMAKVPIGRAARPEEIVGMVSYLLSDDASYTTGAVIPIDGGRTAS